MDILVLEDSEDKYSAIKKYIEDTFGDVKLQRVACLVDFVKLIEREQFDLLIVDLVAPRFKDSTDAEDITDSILEACRDGGCKNKSTPAIALTAFGDASDNNYKSLNAADISVLTFGPDGKWKVGLQAKVMTSKPHKTYDVVVVCALAKEVAGFIQAGYDVGQSFTHGILDCREIKLPGRTGVIVTAARMGLVTCAITATQAIDVFRPRLIVMSGICAGIPKKANLLDVVIAEVCHQHDFGKWSVNGYEAEVYTVPINARLGTQLKQITRDKPDFVAAVVDGVQFDKDELPPHLQRLAANVYLAPASSGSAVIADEKMVEVIRDQQRKGTIFEMESFALYEAARLQPSEVLFFSAKAVVDDGTAGKNDQYHRLACLLSARTVVECIRHLTLMPEPLI